MNSRWRMNQLLISNFKDKFDSYQANALKTDTLFKLPIDKKKRKLSTSERGWRRTIIGGHIGGRKRCDISRLVQAKLNEISTQAPLMPVRKKKWLRNTLQQWIDGFTFAPCAGYWYYFLDKLPNKQFNPFTPNPSGQNYSSIFCLALKKISFRTSLSLKYSQWCHLRFLQLSISRI